MAHLPTHFPGVPMPINNVDTDQIIPARYLKVTDKLGLGTEPVLRLALPARRLARARVCPQPARTPGRADPAGRR